MLLQAASAVGLAVGLQFWRWYCRRHHQGFEGEREDGEVPAEQVSEGCAIACSRTALIHGGLIRLCLPPSVLFGVWFCQEEHF